MDDSPDYVYAHKLFIGILPSSMSFVQEKNKTGIIFIVLLKALEKQRNEDLK
jgi:hypothetical protein